MGEAVAPGPRVAHSVPPPGGGIIDLTEEFEKVKEKYKEEEPRVRTTASVDEQFTPDVDDEFFDSIDVDEMVGPSCGK